MDLIISPSESGCCDAKCNDLSQQHRDKGVELYKNAQRYLESIAVKRKDLSGEKIRVGDVYVRNRGVTGRHNILEQFELLRNESSRQCFYISAGRWSSEKL